jgi:hypothetical protein
VKDFVRVGRRGGIPPVYGSAGWFPEIRTARWRIVVLRLVFWRRGWVQLRKGGPVYWLRFRGDR